MRHHNLLADAFDVVIDGVVMDWYRAILDGLVLQPADRLAVQLVVQEIGIEHLLVEFRGKQAAFFANEEFDHLGYFFDVHLAKSIIHGAAYIAIDEPLLRFVFWLCSRGQNGLTHLVIFGFVEFGSAVFQQMKHKLAVHGRRKQLAVGFGRHLPLFVLRILVDSKTENLGDLLVIKTVMQTDSSDFLRERDAMVHTILGIEFVEQKFVLLGCRKPLVSVFADIIANMNRKLLFPEFMHFHGTHFFYFPTRERAFYVDILFHVIPPS